MARQKERSELEALRAKNRKLKSAIKALSKQAGRGDKIKDRYEDLELEMVEKLLEEDAIENNLVTTNDCPECGKGEIEKISLGPKDIMLCNNCKYRIIVRK